MASVALKLDASGMNLAEKVKEGGGAMKVDGVVIGKVVRGKCHSTPLASKRCRINI